MTRTYRFRIDGEITVDDTTLRAETLQAFAFSNDAFLRVAESGSQIPIEQLAAGYLARHNTHMRLAVRELLERDLPGAEVVVGDMTLRSEDEPTD